MMIIILVCSLVISCWFFCGCREIGWKMGRFFFLVRILIGLGISFLLCFVGWFGWVNMLMMLWLEDNSVLRWCAVKLGVFVKIICSDFDMLVFIFKFGFLDDLVF